MGEIAHRHHFLPQGTQRLFADPEGRIAAVSKDGRRFETRPLNVGLERDLYLRERPTGEKSDDIERVSLADIEQKAFPVLQTIADRWPLSGEEKVRVASLLGVQLVRGPRWFAFHQEFTETNYRKYLDQGRFREISEEHGVAEKEVYEAHVDHELDDTRKLLQMLHFGTRAATILGSMTWALLRFRGPALALADHPVVVWPMSADARYPMRADPNKIGLLNLFEVRVPIAPNLALLLAWADRPDLAQPIDCAGHHARNLNSFSIEEAERHWIHHPGRVPRSGKGPWLPLAPEMLAGYSVDSAVRSQLRNEVSRDLNSKLGQHSRQVEIRFMAQHPDSLAV